MAVTMLPFGSLENCFANVAYAAEVSDVTEVSAEDEGGNVPETEQGEESAGMED